MQIFWQKNVTKNNIHLHIPDKCTIFAQKMALHIEYTTEEKAAKITQIIKDVAAKTEFGAADLKSLHHQAARIGINIDELQQYIALLKSRDIVAGEVVGSNYYIIPKNL